MHATIAVAAAPAVAANTAAKILQSISSVAREQITRDTSPTISSTMSDILEAFIFFFLELEIRIKKKTHILLIFFFLS